MVGGRIEWSYLSEIMFEIASLLIPNVLNGGIEDVEVFYGVLDTRPSAEQYAFDMGQIDFIRPYGLVALMIGVRRLASITGRLVRLENVGDQVYLYLHRMDFFSAGSDWVLCPRTFEVGWERDEATSNLLEITLIAGPEDVAKAITRTERIFARWLPVANLHSLLNVLSELYANIYQHSTDSAGCVLIQKYHSVKRGRVTVRLAVGDLGIGVRASLASQHHDIGPAPLDYLYAAMNGRTSRDTSRGGLGLRLVEQIVGREGGQLWLRSETAAILSHGPDSIQGRDKLAYLPGTQIAVEFYAPLPTDA
jgi:hypothetical protein